MGWKCVEERLEAFLKLKIAQDTDKCTPDTDRTSPHTGFPQCRMTVSLLPGCVGGSAVTGAERRDFLVYSLYFSVQTKHIEDHEWKLDIFLAAV